MTRTSGALKLTIQQFYRVNGESTQVRASLPTSTSPRSVIRPTSVRGKWTTPEFDKVNALPVAGLNQVNLSMVRELETRSLDRRKANAKFQKQDERIAKFVERKARHAISLNEEKFRAEFVPDEDLTKDEDKPKKDKTKKKFTEHPAWDSDYYNDEVATIVADYLTLSAKAPAGPRIGDQQSVSRFPTHA